MLRPANAVIPFNSFAVVEQEAPMRLDPVSLFFSAFSLAQRQRRSVVDWRQPAPERNLAFEIELLPALITRINPACAAQGLERSLIEFEPQRLALLAVGFEPQPG